VQHIESGGKSVSATVFVGGTQIISAGVLASATTFRWAAPRKSKAAAKPSAGRSTTAR
jgi:hypothetical protein